MAAFVEKYVATTGSGSDNGDDAAHPYNWAQVNDAMTAGGSLTAAAGWRFNIKSGTYSIGSTDTWTIDGTTASPIVFRGYKTTIGDLDPGGASAIVRTNQGALVTTDMPVLSYASGTRLAASGADNIILMNLKITVASTGFSGAAAQISGANSCAFHCYCDNISTNAAAVALQVSSGHAIACDAALTGASGGTAAIVCSSVGSVIGCRVILSQAVGIQHSNTTNCLVANCLVANCGGDGIQFSGGTAGQLMQAINNTVYGCTGQGISIGNVNYTRAQLFVGNHVTDCARGVLSGYDGTGQLAMVGAFNRWRDNTSGNYDGFDGSGTDGWAQATAWGDVLTDNNAAGDFVAVGSNDYRLISAAPGKAGGLFGAEMGAINRQDNYPAVTDVQSPVTYGQATEFTGTFAEPAVTDVKTGVQYGAGGTEFTGTYAASGGVFASNMSGGMTG